MFVIGMGTLVFVFSLYLFCSPLTLTFAIYRFVFQAWAWEPREPSMRTCKVICLIALAMCRMVISNDTVSYYDRLSTSILQWTQINSEVLLIVFLPGLTFPDAFDLNVSLFLRAFWQVSVGEAHKPLHITSIYLPITLDSPLM